jgi:spore coat polysaccharide biosynthesis protein SpsF (cytidylyltransferase family)
MAAKQAKPATWEEAVAAATDDAVVRWRMSVLLRAGYLWDDALELAMDTKVDLHLAVELVDKGCESATARRILT